MTQINIYHAFEALRNFLASEVRMSAENEFLSSTLGCMNTNVWEGGKTYDPGIEETWHEILSAEKNDFVLKDNRLEKHIDYNVELSEKQALNAVQQFFQKYWEENNDITLGELSEIIQKSVNSKSLFKTDLWGKWLESVNIAINSSL